MNGAVRCARATRPIAIMLPFLLLILVFAEAKARTFNITHLIVPEVVLPNQDEVEIECRYDANFTLLNWFKGPNEFFRYRPGTTPSTRSFPILGVGRIEMLGCGPTACHLKLGSLTEDASGLYRCDIERDVPPYKFEARSAYMHVYGHQARRPLLEGLAEEFGEGDEMQAHCRGSPDSELRWYINGREIEEMRGSSVLKKKAFRWIFVGVPPTVTVQCAEFRYGKLSGSKEAKAHWNENKKHKDESAQEQRNDSNNYKISIGFLIVLPFVWKNII